MYKEFCNNIYVVNLPTRTDRLKTITKELIRVELPFKVFKAFLPTNNTYTRAENYANYLSHMEIVKEAKNNNYKNVMILEDDCIFSKDFALQINKSLLELKEDWNILYLGMYSICEPVYISDAIVKVRNAYTTHAYCVNNNFYDILLKQKPNKLDYLYTTLQDTYNFYCCNPMVAWQLPGFSNIMNQYEDYTKYLPDYNSRFV